MISAAMLKLIEDTGQGVLVLIDGLQELEFARSRLTRGEVSRQLLLMADTLDALAPATQNAMPEIDWPGWRSVAMALRSPAMAQDDAAWFGATALTPATLSWLRVYRRAQPELFDFKPRTEPAARPG
ncbi:hypothetical protein BurJ1DRAFT_1012 [Burkholderiales bacterium JOSHI_001]|nr:hypothetical protein BurJ1DRAFT_1012 [Burkholderiales bacterium JOSHI_001]